MGRYYNTDNGREGKFMFGVQPSSDPEEMGMHEEEPTQVDYYADTDDVENIKKKLDEQYDILGVPKEERIYYCKTQQEAMEFENKSLHDRVFVTVNKNDAEAMAKHKDETRWASDKGDDYLDFEIKGRALPLARIRLALDILSDIEDTGSCMLSAEL